MNVVRLLALVLAGVLLLGMACTAWNAGRWSVHGRPWRTVIALSLFGVGYLVLGLWP